MSKTTRSKDHRSAPGAGLWLPSTIEVGAEDRFRILTSQELAVADLAITYLVEDVLVRGQPMLLCGPMKSLKTGTAIDLGIALASGGMFLGYFPVPVKVRVLLMSGESGLATLRETAQRICVSAGRDLEQLDHLYWSDDLPQLTSELDLTELTAAIKRLGIEVLMIDPAFLCMPVGDSAGNLFRMGELLAGLSNVCKDTGCTPILLHHAKKGGLAENQPLELQQIAWSGFGEFARQWLLLSRRARFDPGSGVHRLWLSLGGSAGHGSLHGLDVEEGTGHGRRVWRPTLLSPDECHQALKEQRQASRKIQSGPKREALLKRVVEALAELPDGETGHALKTRLKVGLPALVDAIALGIERQQLEPWSIVKGNNKQPCAAYRLSQARLRVASPS